MSLNTQKTKSNMAKKTTKRQDPVYNYDWVTPELIDAFEVSGITDPIEQKNLLQAILAENGGKPRPEKYNGPSRDAYFEAKYGVGTSKGKLLGNDQKGDGVKYAGRGLFQLTGKWNYDRMQKLTGIKVKDNPELMQHPETDQIVSLKYLKDKASRMGIKDFKDPANLHKVIHPSETWQQRQERVLPISDVDWQVILDTRASRPKEPVAQPAVKMTLEQFRKEQSGGITPDTTPPAR
jgi:hypothetical protein